MPPPPNAGVISVEVSFRPDELIAAWRPESRRLVFPLREPMASRQRLQARVSAVGLGVAATITGRVVSARRLADSFRVELQLDDARLQAIERLVAVAGGAPVTYQARAPRLLASVPAVVTGNRGPIYMATVAVSEAGCGLAWSGPLPEVGAPLDLRLGAGSLVARFCAEVRWTTPGRAPGVGLHFVAGEHTAWARILENLRRSGAPPA